MGRVIDGYEQAIKTDFSPFERFLLVLVAVAYPFHFPMPTPTGSINMSYGDPLVGLVCVLFVGGVLGVNQRALLRYVLLIVLFVGIALVSLAANAYISPLPETYDPLIGIVEIVKFLGGVAWMVATYALLARFPADRLRDFAIISVALALIFAFSSLLATVIGGSSWARPTGPFQSANIYANYLLLNVTLGVYLVAYYARPIFVGISTASCRRVRRLLLWVILPISIAGLVITGSRGALLGFVAGTAALAALTIRQISLTRAQIRSHTVVYGVYAVFGVVFLVVFVPQMAERFLETIVEGGGDNSSARIENWQIAWGAFRENPLVGIGYGQYPEYMAVVMPRRFGIFAHNTYMTTLAQMGVLGLAVLVTFVALVIRDGWILINRRHVVVVAPIVAVIVGTFVQGLVADVDNFRSLWIAIGALAAFYAAERTRSDSTVAESAKYERSKCAAKAAQ